MNPDVDGVILQAAVPLPAKTEPEAAADVDVKAVLLAQDQMIKSQAAKIADLEKQVGALAGAAQAVPAPQAPQASPQDRAFEAMLEAYGLKK